MTGSIHTRARLALAALTAALLAATPAFAEEASPAAGDAFAQLMPLLLIMVVFYFLLIRPQNKRLKEHKKMIEELKKGDRIITGGGIYGTITDVKERELRIEIASGVHIRIRRDTVAALVAELDKEEEQA